MRSRYACLTTATLMLSLAGCGDVAKLPVASGYGPNPALPEPNKSLIPTVNIAEATGWPDGRRPQAAAGLEVRAFARAISTTRAGCMSCRTHDRTLLEKPSCLTTRSVHTRPLSG